MTDKQNHVSARTLWSRLLFGVELSAEEMTELQNALASDRELRKELDSDATMHALLLSVRNVKQSENDFVRSVMARCSNESLQNTDGDTLVAKSQTTLRLTSNEIQSSATSNETQKTVRPDSDLRRAIPAAPVRRLAHWQALTVTSILFVLASVSIWWSLRDSGTSASSDLQAVKNPLQGNGQPLDHGQPEKHGQPEIDLPNVELPNSRIAEVKQPAENAATDDLAPDRALSEKPAPVPNDGIASKIGQSLDGTFVTLTKVEDPVWERQWSQGDRLGSEVIRLFGGRLELTFDDGASVTLEGPIEFRPMTSGQMQLRRGKLMAAVPKQAIGFTVTTPTSEVVDLGTEFEVSVKETGASDVVVKKGEIEVMPAGVESKDRRKWRLVPDGLNQASFFERSGDEKTSPVSAAIRGNGGVFQGMISINGKTAEFSSAEAFDDVREQVVQQFEKSQQETLQQWTEFVDAMHRNVQGTMQLNGAEVPFGNFDDVMKLQQQMMERMQIPGGDPANLPGTSFTGSININGKVINFKSREEYEEARRTAFGAAANFGAGDVLRPRTRTKRK
ncbi:MAG: FecR domain-containing protein [Planctomycetaceae bacterium]|nr:FecR domain-containing protein [Planctomycetaceae bacterium]